MQEITNYNSRLTRLVTHYIMALIGGYMSAYAILNYAGNMASAATANAVEVVLSILLGEREEFFLRLGAVAVYIIGVATANIVPRSTKLRAHIFSLIVDTTMVVLVGIIPYETTGFARLYPIFLMCSIQWQSFKGMPEWGSATVFMTNNIGQTVVSLVDYCYTKERMKLHRAGFYGLTVTSYLIGVAISTIGYMAIGEKASWLALVLLVPAAICVRREMKAEK